MSLVTIFYVWILGLKRTVTYTGSLDGVQNTLILKIEKLKQNAYNTGCSQAVSHPNTDATRLRLTSVIGREPVYSEWYGRRR